MTCIFYRKEEQIHDQAGISVMHQMKSMFNQFNNLTQLLPSKQSRTKGLHEMMHKLQSKQKRFAPIVMGVAAAIIGGILGTFMGRYSQQQIDSIKLVKDLRPVCCMSTMTTT